MLPESTLLMIRTFHLLQEAFISLIMMTNWNTTFGPILPTRVTTLERILPFQDLTSIICILKSNWPWKTQSTSIMILQFLQSNSHCRIILLWTLLLWGSLFAFPFTLKSAKQFTADGSLHWLCVSLFPFYVCLERKEKQATGLSSWNWYLRKRIFCPFLLGICLFPQPNCLFLCYLARCLDSVHYCWTPLRYWILHESSLHCMIRGFDGA